MPTRRPFQVKGDRDEDMPGVDDTRSEHGLYDLSIFCSSSQKTVTPYLSRNRRT